MYSIISPLFNKRFIHLALYLALCLAPTSGVGGNKYTIDGTAELNTLKIEESGIVLEYFDFKIEDASFGGQKATFHVRAYNSTDQSLNYSLYFSAYDADGEMLCCFSFEPNLNIHSSKGMEVYKQTRLVSERYTPRIKANRFLVKLIVQKK